MTESPRATPDQGSAELSDRLFAADAIERVIDDYIEDYEMVGEAPDGRDACHVPTEGERILIKDAILGLLGDPAWDAEWGKLIADRARELAAATQPAPSARPLTDDEREHIHAAIEMLGDYEATAREHGNDSIAAGAGATRYVLEKLFRFLPSRAPATATQPAPSEEPAELPPLVAAARQVLFHFYADKIGANVDLEGSMESLRKAADAAATQGAPTPALIPGEAYRRPGLVCGRCGCADLMHEGAPTPAQGEPAIVFDFDTEQAVAINVRMIGRVPLYLATTGKTGESDKPRLICPRCKVDRFQAACPGPLHACPMKAEAQTGETAASSAMGVEVALAMLHRALDSAGIGRGWARADVIGFFCNEWNAAAASPSTSNERKDS